jgi:hypothetical protein
MKIINLNWLSSFLILFVFSNCSKDTELLSSANQEDIIVEEREMSTDNNSSTYDPSTPTTTDDPATIKSEVVALLNTVGRTSQNALKSVDSSLPNGVSLNGAIITISADGAFLEDYDFRGYTIFLNSSDIVIKNCLLGEKGMPRDGKRVLDIRGDAKNFRIEENDFVGFKGLGSGVSSAIFQRILTSNVAGTGGTIQRNSFKHFGNDMVKTSGGVLIQENVFYAESNIEAVPSGVWNGNDTYALNEVVQDTGSGKHFISLVANNQGNTLPPINSSDGNWQYYDPHCDMVNPFDNSLPSTIRRNLFIRNTQHSLLSESDKSFALGLTNAIRIVRNNNDNSRHYENLLVEENVILGTEFYGGGAIPIQASSTGGTWTNPVLLNNLIDKNSKGNYIHPSTVSSVDWRQNFDATSLAPINP